MRIKTVPYLIFVPGSKKQNMKKTVLIFGLISGFIAAAIMSISMAACYGNPDFGGSMVLGYASMLIAFSLIFVGVKNLRDKHNDGAISFGKAFGAGLLITFIASSMYVLAWLVEYYCFMPEFMDRYTDHTLRQAQKSGADAATIAAKAAEMAKYKEMYKNPIFVILFTYAEIFPVGFIVSLICALILKRKPKQPATAIS